jgi:hypothetical protein
VVRHYFFYRRDALKTTWTFRVLALAATILLVFVTRGWWEPSIAAALICPEEASASDAILIENLEPEYLLLERAAGLRKQGLASRVFVTVPASWDSPEPNLVSVEILKVMARVAQLDSPEIITVRPVEPFSLSVAEQLRDHLVAQKIRSVLVVSPGFRSRRSFELNRRVLGRAGVHNTCAPVVDKPTASHWAGSWHGVQNVALEFIKLQYYRFYVLPFRAGGDDTSG